MHFTPTSVEYCTISLYCMRGQQQHISWLIVTMCLPQLSSILEIDFHMLIMHLTSSYSHVNNPMHIPANYSCDSRTVSIDMTRDLCSVLFTFLYFSIETQRWTVLVCAYVFSIVFAEHLFPFELWISILQLLIIIFVILRIELHVCIRMAFRFCEINGIYNQGLLHYHKIL